ncbi:MAG: feruloyl-CoA synthase [Minwuia sp.]|uniref:feruloyl-CoA synthase n=1 Tax=Minwuia sp. TaxID=2493630 RepID=UPI003A877284
MDAETVAGMMLARRADKRDMPDGGFVLTSPEPLGEVERSLAHVLRRQAAERPDARFLLQRDGDGWKGLTYAEVLRRANGIAERLLGLGLGPDRPLMILSGNSMGHALAMMGAIVAGVPVVPVSPAYSLMSSDLAKIDHIARLIEPGAIYADAAEPFAKAIAKVGVDLPLLTAADIMGVPPSDAAPGEGPGPDDVVKILFTSGSTGMPKGVVNTHRMLCANQAMAAKGWAFVREEPPVLVDWLPWNHTFGGNMCFDIVLFNGGALHIDEGKPAPGLIEKTVDNLRTVSPTIYFNVPAGFAALLPFLEKDAGLRETFFRRLSMIMYAGAALPQDLWTRLEAVAREAGREPPLMVSAWGSTETAPMASMVHFPIPRAGNIGLPCPGVEIRFAPIGDKLELRVKGPIVTPGYHRQPDLTASAFDAEGFYRMGDAGTLADPDDPAAGIIFDGRVSEDFKLTTGTWVSTGALRTRAVAACSPLVQDMVICGHDREQVGVLIWPSAAGQQMDVAALADALTEKLAAWNAENPGSSTAIRRFRILPTPPSIDANEITDKGYVNQRAALDARKDEVQALFESGASGTQTV